MKKLMTKQADLTEIVLGHDSLAGVAMLVETLKQQNIYNFEM